MEVSTWFTKCVFTSISHPMRESSHISHIYIFHEQSPHSIHLHAQCNPGYIKNGPPQKTLTYFKWKEPLVSLWILQGRDSTVPVDIVYLYVNYFIFFRRLIHCASISLYHGFAKEKSFVLWPEDARALDLIILLKEKMFPGIFICGPDFFMADSPT